jgi:hypothetical protein
MKSTTFERFAGYSAILAGLVGLLYSFAFIVLLVGGKAPELGALLSAVFLMLGGLFSSAALVAVFNRICEISPAATIWGVLLSLFGALGAVVHGGYDLANLIQPPAAAAAGLAGLPSQVDPRGLLTFGIAGVGLLVLAGLIRRSQHLPGSLGTLGIVLAALLIVIYLGRLIILSPTNPLVALPAVVTGFIVNPVWYVWLGISLLRFKPKTLQVE